MGMVKVTNKHPVRFRDRFDGKDYVFEPNEAVIMNEDAAKHIFGYGDPNKVPYLSRIGKMTTTQVDGAGGLKDAMKWLERFEFREQVLKMEDKVVEALPFADDPIEEQAPVTKGSRASA
jgi:hypothetical protein